MHRQILKLLCTVTVLAMIFAVIPVSAYAMPEGITAGAYVLMDAATGQVLAEKNMDQQLFPASITKIMTVLLAVENANPDAVVTVSSDATIMDKPDYSDSMHIALTAGENIRMEDLMYAAMIESANDAANCIAESVSGSVEAFAELMNKRAAELGAKNTHFTNPHGLPDDNHLTTAFDMAQITRYAITNEKFVKLFSTVIYEIPPDNKKSEVLTISSGFSMMKGADPHYYEGIIGGKTGYTRPAGYTGVAAARRGDKTLVAVVLGSTTGNDRFSDLKTLLDYGFDNFTKTPITTTEVKPTVSKVVENGSVVATVAISPASDMYYLRHTSVAEEDVLLQININDTYSWYDIDPSITLSISDGTYMYPNIGTFALTHTEKQLTNPIPITSDNTIPSDVSEETPATNSDTENKGMPTALKVFLIIIAVILILLGAFVLLFFISNARRRKRDKLRRLKRQEMYEQSRRELMTSRRKDQ
ncbi:MAG: D-alanyl-D-alanine carboxypeptidase [Clostridia bacterium]|nr:D-alanyl-D-alanine carboxypeptidase [Clostridia bacterium]